MERIEHHDKIELAKFVAELRAVAKVALSDDPQQLEKLGIMVRSSPAAKSQKTQESG